MHTRPIGRRRGALPLSVLPFIAPSVNAGADVPPPSLAAQPDNADHAHADDADHADADGLAEVVAVTVPSWLVDRLADLLEEVRQLDGLDRRAALFIVGAALGYVQAHPDRPPTAPAA